MALLATTTSELGRVICAGLLHTAVQQVIEHAANTCSRKTLMHVFYNGLLEIVLVSLCGPTPT